MDLKELRSDRGFQRKFVATKIGISGKHLNDIEAGRVNLTTSVATKFSNFYGIDVTAIKEMYEEGKNE
ncbi:helix-turn-helix domain-containing protein [Clostridium sp. 001]|uniref:helix-turn-helix domain-containing protein n=1 Tax=Clostridium sp. 001 TaxID=1970093 RepID=UPI001C2CB4C1|nr:helix-turn-helix transcriptional regulator [Clostridium sp. 001]QXE20426.1 transcriptional regulator [Clostridium sp. 001]